VRADEDAAENILERSREILGFAPPLIASRRAFFA
jgi:hypothetical protein